AADGEAAAIAAIAKRPDLALLDVQMPGGGGVAAAMAISSSCPDTRIVALSAHEDRESVSSMMHAGASGYIAKGVAPSQIIETLKRCAAGESVYTPIAAGSVLRDFVTSSRGMQDARRQRVERTARMHTVCSPSSIETVYQPIVGLADGRTRMLEALTRFHTPFDIDTGEWFQEALDLDMAIDLELATLRSAVTDLADHDYRASRISINLSPDTLLDPALESALEAVEPDRLTVEITEHARIADYAATKAALSALSERGVKIAIDDAGAGFASLRHILSLMPDLIKLDISLTRGIDADQARRALAKGLITFAQEIGAEIVAEGIETSAELECLRELGATYGQGYIIARPAPLSEMRQLYSHI
ncbi:MAG: EAL domain-containing protein, partial [Solirubrobacterales bacterium]